MKSVLICAIAVRIMVGYGAVTNSLLISVASDHRLISRSGYTDDYHRSSRFCSVSSSLGKEVGGAAAILNIAVTCTFS